MNDEEDEGEDAADAMSDGEEEAARRLRPRSLAASSSGTSQVCF